MAYILSEHDTERIDFLALTGKKVLRELNVSFDHSYLYEKLILSYHAIFDGPQHASQTDVEIVDRNDPSNLAIVLLNALSSYHIKSTVVEGNGLADDATVLVILNADGEVRSYRELMGLYRSISTTDATIEHFIVLEKSCLSEEPGHKKRYWEKRLQSLLGWVLSITFIVMVGLSVWNGITAAGSMSWIFLMIILAAGLYIAYDLFQLEKNNLTNDYLVKRLCLNQRKGLNCQKVLHSRASKIADAVSMTDIGAVYFASLFLFLIYSLINNTYTTSLGVFLVASIVPLPYTAFSVYYQLKVIKKVCVLCMLVQLLLVLQFTFFMLIRAYEHFSIPIPVAGSLLVIALLVTAYYFLFARSRKQKTELSRLQVESYMQKNDEEFFRLLLNREPYYEEPELDGMLQLGNPQAGVKMTAFLSLSCKPCSNMLNMLVKMADWFSDQLSINILIMPDEPSKELLLSLYHFTLQGEHNKALDILRASYRNNNRVEKDLSPADTAACRKILHLHARWLQNHYVPHTPMIIYEGRSLPNSYHEEDLLRNIITRELAKMTVDE